MRSLGGWRRGGFCAWERRWLAWEKIVRGKNNFENILRKNIPRRIKKNIGTIIWRSWQVEFADLFHRRENIGLCRRKKQIARKNQTFAGKNLLSGKLYLFSAKEAFLPVKVILFSAFNDCARKKPSKSAICCIAY